MVIKMDWDCEAIQPYLERLDLLIKNISKDVGLENLVPTGLVAFKEGDKYRFLDFNSFSSWGSKQEYLSKYLKREGDSEEIYYFSAFKGDKEVVVGIKVKNGDLPTALRDWKKNLVGQLEYPSGHVDIDCDDVTAWEKGLFQYTLLDDGTKHVYDLLTFKEIDS